MSESDAYRQKVKAFARECSGEPIFNAAVEHASIVIETIFSVAEKSVSVLSGTLNPRVYGRDEVITEARLFLVSSYRNALRIILESDSPLDRQRHPLLRACAEFDNVQLRLAPPEVQELYDFHFVVANNDCYRFESDKRRPVATTKFGDAEGATNLNKIYEELWQQCRPIDFRLASA